MSLWTFPGVECSLPAGRRASELLRHGASRLWEPELSWLLAEPSVIPAGEFVPADISTAEGVRSLAERTLEMLGGVDVIVSNAGSQTQAPAGAALSDADWMRELDTNLMSSVRLDRALLPHMQAGGAIVHVTSGAARMPRPASLAYSAAKAALTAYSKGLANEVGPRGIRVNTVVPGLIRTTALDRRLVGVAEQTDTDFDTVLDQMVDGLAIPLGRAGTSEEAAELIAFWSRRQQAI